MFSQDPKHYRPTPRTMNQAFGPYSKLTLVSHRHIRRERWIAAAGVVACGVVYGLLMYWGVQ